MDRRRGAQGSPSGEDGDRARKRRKQTSSDARSSVDPRTVYEAVWNYQERNRNIRQHFEELPSKDMYPDYYTKITRPISLHEIKVKLDRNQYAGFEAIREDLFLMCDNAAVYNKSKSQVHSDALRLRKLVESFEEPAAAGVNTDHADASQPTPGRPSRGSKAGPGALQQAMLKIIDDMLGLTHESGDLVAQYFKNLPSRKFYADYYRVISRPTSITQIQKNVKAGKYQQWSEFEEDFGLIKKNAEEYNAEGSDIVRDARLLETHFLKRLREEKIKLGDSGSSGIKLRLNMGGHHAHPTEQPVPKIKLNVGGKHPPQPPVQRPPPEAPTRRTPQPTSNGASHPPPPPPPQVQAPSPAERKAPPPSRPAPQPSPTPPANYNTQPAAQTPSRAHQPRQMVPPANSVSATPPRTRLDSIKTNGSRSPPPGLMVRTRSETPQYAMSPSIGHPMPPPSQRLSSTPVPHGFSPVPQSRGQPPGPTSVPPQAVQPPAFAHHQIHQEPTMRPEGKDKSDALITNLQITSTSAINPEAKFLRDLEPDDRKVTAQYFIHLPAEFDTLSIIPTLAPNLVNRELYIVRVVHYCNIQHSRLVTPTAQQKKNEPIYNIRLTPGLVNTVEVTAVTQAPKNGVNGINGFAAGVERWEMERFRVYITPLQQ